MCCSEELESLKNTLYDLRNTYYSRKGKQEQLLENKAKIQDQLVSLDERVDIYEKVRVLLHKATEYAREESRKQIEALVTNCLQYIFDSSMEFRIEIIESRGRPEAEFYVITHTIEGNEIKTRPQEARGGGVVDIISLALRVAMMQNININIGGPLILDEPAKHVSEEFIVQVGEFLKQASRMFNRQIIMVTHNRYLAEIADKSYRIEFIGGESQVNYV